MRSRLLWCGAVLLALLLLVLLGVEFEMRRTSAASVAVTIEVPAGASLRSVLGQLSAQQAMRHPRLVEWRARLLREVPRIRTGTYRIPPHSSPLQVLSRLERGLVVLEQVTIIEGWAFSQMRQALNAHPKLSHGMRALSDTQLMKELGHEGQSPEGRFFPDTYSFSAGTADRRIYELAYARMSRELDAAWQSRARDLPLRSADEALIFASIVEKETARDDERRTVAAVFANRLRKGMRLQSDPTVIYGLGNRYDGDIRSRDLSTDTPYNTYTRGGLPPTPIALPGAASLRAATDPAESKALFFVATGAGDGTHHFSETLSEHNNAVQRFLQRTGARAANREVRP